jgi:hypothetical protein
LIPAIKRGGVGDCGLSGRGEEVQLIEAVKLAFIIEGQ